jgi:hypothetical protein
MGIYYTNLLILILLYTNDRSEPDSYEHEQRTARSS